MRTSMSLSELGYSDSNQEKQDQNLLCYHYTIAQNHKMLSSFCFDGAKVQHFLNTQSIYHFFFKKIFSFPKNTMSLPHRISI